MNKYIDLLQIEYLKFRKNSVVVVLSALFVLFFPFVILVLKKILPYFPPPFPSVAAVFEFPTVWDYQGYVGNLLVRFFLGFLMIYIVTSEVGNRTMRQGIINGQTRYDYFISKVLVMLVISATATIIYALSSIILGVLHTDGYELSILWDNNFAVFRFFLMCIGYLSFAMFLAFLIRKGTLAILLFFAYNLFLEPIFRAIHLYYTEHRSSLFYPMNVVGDLMPNPIFKIPDFISESKLGFKILLSNTEAILFSLAFVIIFIGFTWRRFSTKDI